MGYSNVALRRIRARLEIYRKENGVNGGDRPWHIVAQDLLDLSGPDEDHDPGRLKAEGESLRRFAAGKSTPQPARCEQIQRLLMENGYLTEDDLGAGDKTPEDVRGLYRFFRPSKGSALEGVYAAICSDGSRPRHYISVLRGSRSGEHLSVEEEVHTAARAAVFKSFAEASRFLSRHSLSVEKRSGWLVEAGTDQILIFFRSDSGDFVGHYSGVIEERAAYGDAYRIRTTKHLDRVGTSLAPGASLAQNSASLADTPWEYVRLEEEGQSGNASALESEIAHFGPVGYDSRGMETRNWLISAAAGGDAERVSRILARFSGLANERDPRSGMTALHFAAAHNAKAVVRTLVNSGLCDLTLKDVDGRTAAQLAYEVADNPALGRYLLKKEYQRAGVSS